MLPRESGRDSHTARNVMLIMPWTLKTEIMEQPRTFVAGPAVDGFHPQGLHLQLTSLRDWHSPWEALTRISSIETIEQE